MVLYEIYREDGGNGITLVSLDFSFRNTKLIIVYIIERTPIRNVYSRGVVFKKRKKDKYNDQTKKRQKDKYYTENLRGTLIIRGIT
jgi:MinD-like ATPase involved in chromosome partitioning or flagellar assembly